jgi:Ca2+/Na+ antiporter
VILNNLKRKTFYAYVLWWLTTFFLLDKFYPSYYGFRAIFLALTSQLTLVALMGGLLYLLINEFNIFKLREKLKLNEHPAGLFYIIAMGIFGAVTIPLAITIYYRGGIFFYFSFFYQKLWSLITYVIKPFSRNRWSLTVAESSKTYFVDWYNIFGGIYLLLLVVGSIFLFYEIFKESKKYKFKFTFAYVLFLFFFLFSAYSNSSVLNGESTLSLLFSFGSLFAFAVFLGGYFLYSFYESRKELLKTEGKEEEKENLRLINYKELAKTFANIDEKYLILFLWLFIGMMAAKSANRLYFIFIPITTIFLSYIVIRLLDSSLETKDKAYKFIGLTFLFFFIFTPFVNGGLLESGIQIYSEADRSAPFFDSEWQKAMAWVREKTSRDSVFAHWWDYGYLVQTFGERATLSDGGNARGAINYFTARHFLTGRNREEALELLKTHNATHALIVSEEIGKYTAFSAIGSDENYDKYSYIPTFLSNPNEISEQRDREGNLIRTYIYKGEFIIDEDFFYNYNLFPIRKAIVRGIILTIRGEGDNLEVSYPRMILVHNKKQEEIPMNCLFWGGKEYIYNKTKAYDGCFVIIPRIYGATDDEMQADYMGAGLFLSPNTRNTLFSQLYLMDKDGDTSKEWMGFTKVYDDSREGFSLAYYNVNEMLIGPIKIWKLNYDEDIKTNPIYLSTEIDPALEKI